MTIVFVVIVVISIIFIFLSYLTKRYNRRSSSEVADIIEHFIEGKGSSWDWDDFVSSPINNFKLDKIRIRCAQLGKEFPPKKSGEYTNEDGLKILKQYINELRGK